MSDSTYSPPGPIAISFQIGLTVIAVGGIGMVLMPLTTHTSGASRSAHIKWQHRETEIEQVISDAESPVSMLETDHNKSKHENSSKKTDYQLPEDI